MRTASKHPGCTINRIELHQTHAELEHAHITYTCTHQSTVAEKPGFSSSPYLIRHHIPVSERLLVSDSPPSSSSSGSSVPSHYHNNCTYSMFMLLCCFHNNNGREHYPNDSANGGGCCLGGCIIGVSGAGSLCVHALGLCMHSCIHSCTH